MYSFLQLVEKRVLRNYSNLCEIHVVMILPGTIARIDKAFRVLCVSTTDVRQRLNKAQTQPLQPLLIQAPKYLKFKYTAMWYFSLDFSTL